MGGPPDYCGGHADTGGRLLGGGRGVRSLGLVSVAVRVGVSGRVGGIGWVSAGQGAGCLVMGLVAGRFAVMR